MSYRNPTEPKYVPIAKDLQEMQKGFSNMATDISEATQQRAEEVKLQKKRDANNSQAWGDGLRDNANGDPLNMGILDTTYGGSNKEYASLKRLIDDNPDECREEGCEWEREQLRILDEAPETSIKLLGNLEVMGDFGENADKTHPEYANMMLVKAIQSQQKGYGSEQGYSIEVNRVKNDDGDYNGDQELVFKGPEFPNGEWRINSTELERFEKNGGSIIPTTPDITEQLQEVSTKSGVFNEGSNGAELSPDMYGIVEGEFEEDGKTPKRKTTRYDANGKLLTKTITGNDGIKRVYSYEVPVIDEEKIKGKIGGYIAAEVDVMFDKKGGGPDAAIAMWNQNLAGTMAKEDIKNFPFLKEDGKMDWYAMDTEKNPPGSKGSIYAEDGNLKPEVKKLYQDQYSNHYIEKNIRGFINNSYNAANMLDGSDVIQREITVAQQKGQVFANTKQGSDDQLPT